MQVRAFAWPIAVVAALVVQSTILEHVAILGVKPDLVLLLTVYTALTRGPVVAMLVGYGAGMFQDALSGGVLGDGAWAKAVCGLAVGVFRGSVFRDHLFTHVAVAMSATFVSEAAYYLLAIAFGLTEVSVGRFVAVAALGTAYNGAVAPSAFWLLNRWLPGPKTHSP